MEEIKPQKNIDQNQKTLRTYSSDMADAVRENEASVIKIALAEQKKHENEDIYRAAEGSNTKKIILVLGGIIFIVLAVIGIYFVVNKNTTDNQPAQILKNIETIISYDDSSFVDLSNASGKEDVANLMKTEVEKVGKPGSIRSIFLTTINNGKPELIQTSGFLSLINTSASGSLVRSLSENYMIGTYTSNINGSKPHLFLIFQTNDYNQAFIGMLDWEKTMLDDMFTLFHIDISGNRNTLFESKFKDIFINNKDARALYDNDGKEVLYYLFVNKNTFVITDNQSVVKEIVSRLFTKNIKPL